MMPSMMLAGRLVSSPVPLYRLSRTGSAVNAANSDGVGPSRWKCLCVVHSHRRNRPEKLSASSTGPCVLLAAPG
eukprot:2437785-Amphidinium_carterae.1